MFCSWLLFTIFHIHSSASEIKAFSIKKALDKKNIAKIMTQQMKHSKKKKKQKKQSNLILNVLIIKFCCFQLFPIFILLF